MAISKKIRFEVFKRDKFTCQYCGRSAPDVVLQVDHIHPKSKGGADDITNLITSCFDCNMGKKDRKLDDTTAIEKRKKQLDDLQERREQLELMMQWHRELSEIDQETIRLFCNFWEALVEGSSVNDYGKKKLSNWVKRFGVHRVAEAMRTSTSQYLVYDYKSKSSGYTEDSIQKAFLYIERICISQEKMEKTPYLKDLYYIRGILKNRGIVQVGTKREWQCINFMENYILLGADIESITSIAKCATSWAQFSDEVENLTGNHGGNNER